MQCLPATAQRAVDRHWALQTRQTKQALNKAQCLAQRHTQQAFDAQAELDGCIRKRRMAASLVCGRGKPLHVLVQPDGQRASGFEGLVVLTPVRGLVSPLVWLAAFFRSHFKSASERCL